VNIPIGRPVASIQNFKNYLFGLLGESANPEIKKLKPLVDGDLIFAWHTRLPFAFCLILFIVPR
jgi:hypothetical protein